jgi:hypothetical protein
MSQHPKKRRTAGRKSDRSKRPESAPSPGQTQGERTLRVTEANNPLEIGSESDLIKIEMSSQELHCQMHDLPDLAGQPPARGFPTANLEAAIAAFRNDLPQLLRDHPGKWVAYRGTQQVGIALEDFELYEACYGAGFDLSDFIVEYIEPQTGDSVLVGPGIMREIPPTVVARSPDRDTATTEGQVS